MMMMKNASLESQIKSCYSQTCVQQSSLGNGNVTVIYRVTAIYRSTLQKIFKATENFGKLSSDYNIQSDRFIQGHYVQV